MEKLQIGNSNDQERLPHHLIVQLILPRLPAKTLLRFKCVTKNWLSEISTPAFQKSHFQTSSSSLKFIHFHNDEDCQMFVMSYDVQRDTIVKELLKLPSDCITFGLYGIPNPITLVGICNGVLCLYGDRIFRLWNPATNQYKRLELGFSFAYVMITRIGFGYVSSIEDYKILVIICGTDYRLGYFYLFSLNSGLWRRLSYLDAIYSPGSLCNEKAVCIDETLYWALRNEETDEMVGVVGFDLVDEQMKMAPKAPRLCQYDAVCHIFKMKGCLSLSCWKYNNPVYDVWMLKGQGSSENWLKLFSIDFKNVPVSILAFTGNDKYLVYVHRYGQLKLIDPCQQDIDLSAKDTNCHYCCHFPKPAMNYVESLFPF